MGFSVLSGFVSDLHQEGQEAGERRERGRSLLFVFLEAVNADIYGRPTKYKP